MPINIIAINKYIIIFCFFAVSNLAYCDNINKEKYPFGRIFTTHNQKLLLDKNRLNEKKTDETIIATENFPSSVEASLNNNENHTNSVAVQGLIVNPDGSYALWINNIHINNKDKNTTGIKAEPNKHSSTVFISKNRKLKSVKPGQQWQLDTNRVVETYNTDNNQNSTTDAPPSTIKTPPIPSNTELNKKDVSP